MTEPHYNYAQIGTRLYRISPTTAPEVSDDDGQSWCLMDYKLDMSKEGYDGFDDLFAQH